MIRLKQLLQEDGDRYLKNKSDENPFYTIDQHRDILGRAFGEQITGVLSAGNNGMVYELASGKLMKITPDTAEVAAVMKLKRLPKMRHMISYYDVRNITNLFKRREVQREPWSEPWSHQVDTDYKAEYETVPVTNFYAVIMDRVTPLNDEEQGIWRDSYEYFLEDTDPLEDFLENIDAFNQPIYVREFWRKIFPQRAQIQRDFKRAGINIYEAHSKNIGFDQFGQIVHYDPWIAGSGWNKPTIKKTRLNKPIELPTKYTTDGIDTPNNPDM